MSRRVKGKRVVKLDPCTDDSTDREEECSEGLKEEEKRKRRRGRKEDIEVDYPYGIETPSLYDNVKEAGRDREGYLCWRSTTSCTYLELILLYEFVNRIPHGDRYDAYHTPLGFRQLFKTMEGLIPQCDVDDFVPHQFIKRFQFKSNEEWKYLNDTIFYFTDNGRKVSAFKFDYKGSWDDMAKKYDIPREKLEHYCMMDTGHTNDIFGLFRDWDDGERYPDFITMLKQDCPSLFEGK